MKYCSAILYCASVVLLLVLAVSSEKCEDEYQDSPQGFGTRLIFAVKNNDLACVKYFLKAGDDPNRWDRNGGRPLHYSAARGSGGILQVLLDYGADPDAVQSKFGTPLMVASCLGQPNEITALLRAGADENLTNSKGETAVDVACTCAESGSDCPLDQILTLLDTSGPGIPCSEIYETDHNGFGTRLQFAIQQQDLYCVMYFLDAGDNPNAGDRNGGKPIIDAGRRHSTEIVMAVLKYGSYGNFQDVGKSSALMYASCNGVANNVDVLVDAGVEIGFKDSEGNTAADLACQCSTPPDCKKDKIVDKIGEVELFTYFNVDFKSDEGILNDGSQNITETNRDCNESCQNTEGCKTWTRIKKETATNKVGECWLRSWQPESVQCFECDSGVVQF